MVDILPLGSGSVDPHIFADPDSGSQNLADLDPKYCVLDIWKFYHEDFCLGLPSEADAPNPDQD